MQALRQVVAVYPAAKIDVNGNGLYPLHLAAACRENRRCRATAR